MAPKEHVCVYIITLITLHTGKIWFAQKIPIMVPTEGMCVHVCTYV